MTLFAALDATRIADHYLDDADPDRWSRAVPVASRTLTPVDVAYSWWALARNPQALLLSGVVGVLVARDAVRAALT